MESRVALTGGNGRGPYETDLKGWYAAIKQSGIEDLRRHDLRHAFGSRLCKRGVNLKVVSELMGHANIKTTAKYAHFADDDRQRAVDLLDQRPGDSEASAKQAGSA